MEITPARERITYQEHLFTERAVSEESAEIIVPDAQPDIARIIGTDAEVFIRGKDADGGKVTVYGFARVSVLYEPDGSGGVHRVAPEIPYTITLTDARIDAGTRVVARVWTEHADASMSNPRKVSARVAVCVSVSCYNENIAETPTARGVEDADDVELLASENEVALPCDVREKTMVITDETTLPPSSPALRELLSSRSALVTEETKVVGSKLIVKGTAHTEILYASVDGEAYAAAFKTEFSQIMELDRANAESEFELLPVVTGAYVDPVSGSDAEQQRLEIEIHAVCQLVATSRYKLHYIADAYGTRHDVETTASPVSFRSRTSVVNTSAVLRGTLNADGATRVVALTARVTACEAVEANGSVEAKAAVAVTGFYAVQDGALRAVTAKFETTAQLAVAVGENVAVRAETGREIYGVIADGGVEIRVPVEFAAVGTRAFEVAPITSIRYDENAVNASNRPSLVIARAKTGDTLWSVAKRYRATRAMVREANSMEDDAVTEGTMLVIPKKR